jgi:hypothetical protein
MRLMRRRTWLGGFLALSLGSCVVAAPVDARAEAPKPLTAAKSAPSGWGSSSAADDVRAGKPLVIEVFVPLCSDAKGGACGKHPGAGDPDDLESNLYWGAVWGARRFLERKWLGWTRTESGQGEGWEIERATYKRTVNGSRWGVDGSVDVYLVLHAVQGDQGSEALERFRDKASGGGKIRFHDGSGIREESVHVVGFMGRNPLLKNGRVPKRVELPEASKSSAAIPSFSIAAYSRETLAPWLQSSGSPALLLARGAVASEGYLLESIARGLAENDRGWALTERATKTYSKYKKLPANVAKAHFSPVLPKQLFEDPKRGSHASVSTLES